MSMRPRAFLIATSIIASLVVGCGQPAAPEQTIAAASLPATTIPPTSIPPTATNIPPTATVEPTTVPPTATVEPTSIPTAVPAASTAPTVAPEVVASDVNDQPQLVGQVASGVGEQPVAAVTPGQPVQLTIPAIKLNYKPLSVGLDEQRVPIVPKHDVGWYNLSAMPGQGENIVFWGHVLRFKAAPKIPAPFARVKELKPGDLVIVTTANGAEARYKVTQSVQVMPDQVKYILPTGKEQVTLVSCIGDNVVSGGEVTKQYRLITIAERVN